MMKEGLHLTSAPNATPIRSGQRLCGGSLVPKTSYQSRPQRLYHAPALKLFGGSIVRMYGVQGFAESLSRWKLGIGRRTIDTRLGEPYISYHTFGHFLHLGLSTCAPLGPAGQRQCPRGEAAERLEVGRRGKLALFQTPKMGDVLRQSPGGWWCPEETFQWLGTLASRQSTLYPAHHFGEVRHPRCSEKGNATILDHQLRLRIKFAVSLSTFDIRHS